jgi:hypothetical protein
MARVISLRHPAAASQSPVYVYQDQRSIPSERRRCRQCPTWLSAYNTGPICSACECRRAEFLMANPLKPARIPREDYEAAIRKREQRAYELRSDGLSWVEIAKTLGYSTRDTARRAAERYRYGGEG